MDKYELLDEIKKYADKNFGPRFFIPGKSVIEVSEPSLNSDDIQRVMNCVLDGWFTEWKEAARLSRLLAAYVGIEYAVLCNSGSSANLLAIAAASDFYQSKKKGGLVITAATCFPTTVSAIIQNGFTPLFIDTDPLTLNVYPDTVFEACKNENVVGAILTHTLGFPFYADDAGKAIGLERWFIEDICDALGAEIGGLKVGCFSDLATLSMFPAHHITTGEGGAVLTDNKDIETLLDQYRSWGRDCWCLPGQDNVCGKRFDYEWDKMPPHYDHKYTFTKVGYNLKMTEIQAALGVSQMSRIINFVEARRNNYDIMRITLDKYSEHLQFVSYPDNVMPSPFGFPISVISKDFNKTDLVAYLEANRIKTRPVFAGNVLRQPMMYNQPYLAMGALEGSDFIMNNTFWIGCHPNIKEPQLAYIFETFENFFVSRGLK